MPAQNQDKGFFVVPSHAADCSNGTPRTRRAPAEGTLPRDRPAVTTHGGGGGAENYLAPFPPRPQAGPTPAGESGLGASPRPGMRAAPFVLLGLLPAGSAPSAQPAQSSREQPAAAAKPITVDSTEEQIRQAVATARMGRKLTPRTWPNGARIAVCLTFD